MSDPHRTEPSIGDRVREVVDWFTQRSRNEWIMFAIGFVVGVIVS